MDALRSYLTPNAKKKQRVEEPFADDASIASEELEEEDDEEPPKWAQQQLKEMGEIKQMLSGLAGLQSDVKDIRTELNHVKLQCSLAQSTAEEAMDVVTNAEDRVKALEDNMLDKVDVQKMIAKAVAALTSTISESSTKLSSIDVAFAKLQSTVKESASHLASTQKHFSSDLDEQFSRTAVMGGFDQDSPKDLVTEYLNTVVLKDVVGVEEVYAYNYGSVGFIRFLSKDDMYKFLKAAGQKPKAKNNGKDLWISVSKPPEERLKAKYLGKLKRVLIEFGLAQPAHVRIDYRRGIVFANKKRIAEWTSSPSGDELTISEVGLKAADIKVAVDKLKDAVAELVQE